MIQAILLGVAQDAGVPQIGCDCVNCAEARANPAKRQYAVSLGLADDDARAFWMLDATPDFREQYDALRQRVTGSALSGVLLTHAHLGHYTGMAQLGKEAMNARGVHVFATPTMCTFLRENAPWSLLVSNGNVELRECSPMSWRQVSPSSPRVRLSDRLHAVPITVPHRAEYSDTICWLIEGPATRLLYLTDIDRWESWTDDLPATLAHLRADFALLDGCFFSADELPRMAQVPHPVVKDTLARMSGAAVGAARVTLVHFNHTNPLLRDGPERDVVLQHGVSVGAAGMAWRLG